MSTNDMYDVHVELAITGPQEKGEGLVLVERDIKMASPPDDQTVFSERDVSTWEDERERIYYAAKHVSWDIENQRFLVQSKQSFGSEGEFLRRLNTLKKSGDWRPIAAPDSHFPIMDNVDSSTWRAVRTWHEEAQPA